MGCPGHKRAASLAPTQAFPMYGEQGMLLVQYVGTDPAETLYGEITNVAYPFDDTSTLFVDIRDATYLLGREFVEVT